MTTDRTQPVAPPNSEFEDTDEDIYSGLRQDEEKPFTVADYMQKQQEVDIIRKSARRYGVDEAYIYQMLEKSLPSRVKGARKTIAGQDIAVTEKQVVTNQQIVTSTETSASDKVRKPSVKQRIPAQESTVVVDRQESGKRRSKEKSKDCDRSHELLDDQYDRSAKTRPSVRETGRQQSDYTSHRREHSYQPRGGHGGEAYQSAYQRNKRDRSPYPVRSRSRGRRSRSRSRERTYEQRRDRRLTPTRVSEAEAKRDEKIDKLTKNMDSLMAMMSGRMIQPK
jgi:hypothetical protein